MKILFSIAFVISCLLADGQQGADSTIIIDNPVNKTLLRIDRPANMKATIPTLLVLYALPNGNSIEWTMGKKMEVGDDWHFDIQHIAAQTRYLRHLLTDQNLVVVYLASQLKSWPAWKRARPDGPAEIKRIVDSLHAMFAAYRPSIILDSHSGGGSFIFGYLDAVPKIPNEISRIAFIDSEYGYEDSLHGEKLANWLKASSRHFLQVLAYNDSVVIYNGKPLVSPTGGTWYRSQLMQRKLAESFDFTRTADTSFIRYQALDGRVAVFLKTNPAGLIYHTEQVARNGFIQTVIGGGPYEKKAGYVYWGNRAYTDFYR